MTVSRPTTLLAHHAPGGFHYDWLIDPPPAPAGHPPAGDAPPDDLPPQAPATAPKLWTARVSLLWSDWPAPGTLQAHALPPHRRRYLNWSGPLSGGRGRVEVAARGQIDIAHWTPTRIDATLHAPTRVLVLALSRPSAQAPHWIIRISP